jgi:hypothetical protein
MPRTEQSMLKDEHSFRVVASEKMSGDAGPTLDDGGAKATTFAAFFDPT